ncbi:hypothetical protein ACFXKJ_19315 [Kitasatospora indigofera]|uniref:hypothetical protein n=1 Tax=Kitasatospora indigofera TaxID=67307 RepID=UPI00369317AE
MDERMVGWLDLGEAERLAVRVLTAQDVAVRLLDEVLGSPLIQVRQQRVAFQHELFGRLLAAEELLWRAETVEDLVSALRAPQREDLGSLVVPLMCDPSMVRDLLRGFSDSGLAGEALAGRLSALAFEVAMMDASQLLDRATAATAGVQVTFVDEFRYRVVPPQEWSPADLSLLGGIGLAVRGGHLLDQLAALLRESEAACWRGAENTSLRHQSILPSLIAATMYGPVTADGDRLPADVILYSVQASWPRRELGQQTQERLVRGVSKLVRESCFQDIGVLMLACMLLRFTDDPEAARLAPQVMSQSWASGAGHLQMAAMDLAIGVRAAADANTTAAITTLLGELQTDNVWVSTVLVDALNIYGLIESPYSPTEVADEVAGILSCPQALDAGEKARWILYSQFEDTVAAPFSEVLAALGEDQLIALHVLALVGSNVDLYTDVLLQELIKRGSAAALPAFEYWAGKLDLRGPFIQDAVRCYLLGIRGCAAHLTTPPPLLEGHDGLDADAWRCYGQIAFWMSRPGLTEEELSQRCQPLWAQLTGPLREAAVDPLHHFHHATYFTRQLDQTLLGRILDCFAEEVRDILHHGLQSPEKTTTLAPYPLIREAVESVIQLLARVGDQHSLELLSSYLTHPKHAATVVSTIRRLKDKT